MKKILPSLFAFLFSSCLFAQTYTGAGGALSDNLDTTYFLLNVNGLTPSAIDTTHGLEKVCINLTHTRDRDLDIYLESPDGLIIELSTDNGDVGDNYTNTCFRQYAPNTITFGKAPFNGDYSTEQELSAINNGQNGNGTWKLRIYDDDNTGNSTGNLTDWKLTFSNDPATTMPFDSTNLPLVVINTNSQTISDDPKIICDMGIIYNGTGVMNHLTDPFNNYKGKIAMELRGSSSQTRSPKKGYGIETRNNDGTKKDTILLGMPAENDWILNACYTDKTYLRNVLAYKLYNDFGRYASRARYCELVINGQYQGVYILLEKVKRDSNRVDISKLSTWENAGDPLTGGYIIKKDKLTGNNNTGWTSPHPPAVSTNGQTVFFQYDYPDADSITVQQQNYIQQYVDSFETTLAGPNFADTAMGYKKYCKPKSFIDFFILNELSRNIDGYRLSTYLYKDKFSKGGGKLTIGPAWDYDIAWLNSTYCGSPSYTGWAYHFGNTCPTDPFQIPFWWEQFLQDPNFTNDLKCRWLELRSTVITTANINSFIDSNALYLTEGVNRNFTVWPILGVYVWDNPLPIPTTYQGEIARMKQWIVDRIAWLDLNMPGSCSVTSVTSTIPDNIVSLFPNPASDQITISVAMHNAAYAVTYDVTGRVIATSSAFEQIAVNRKSGVINTSALAPGLYSYSIVDKNGIILRAGKFNVVR